MPASRHLGKVLAHAERELSSARTMRPAESLPLYKKFLKIEEHRLRLRHQYGGGGREICALRVEMIDVLLRYIFEAAASIGKKDVAPTPLTVIALGGYGRRELNPFSDVDIMFLHDKNRGDISTYATHVIEQVLYLLWDVGFKVGHSTRSIAEAVDLANKDMLTKTAMLESRSLAGDSDLAARFRTAFRQQCVRGRQREYVELRMQDQATRHAKFGNSVYVQEPHLKSGCGGLRDYQNLLWMTFFKEGALTTTHLVGKDWLSEAGPPANRSRLRFSPSPPHRSPLRDRPRHRHAPFHRPGPGRGAARLFAETRHAAERSADEGLLRAHAKYFSRHGAHHGAVRQRTRLLDHAVALQLFAAPEIGGGKARPFPDSAGTTLCPKLRRFRRERRKR